MVECIHTTIYKYALWYVYLPNVSVFSLFVLKEKTTVSPLFWCTFFVFIAFPL